MSLNTQTELPDLIFGMSTSRSTQKREGVSGKNSNHLRLLPDSQIFGHMQNDFIGPPPTKSILSAAASNLPSELEAGDIGTWITLFFVDESNIRDILTHFQIFGDIIRVERTTGNWICIEYARKEHAIRAVKESIYTTCQKHVVISQLGRYTPKQYQKPSKELKELNDVDNNVTAPVEIPTIGQKVVRLLQSIF